MGSVNQGNLTQFLQMAGDAVAHGQIGLQKRLVAGQHITALTGLGVPDFRQQIVRFIDNNIGM